MPNLLLLNFCDDITLSKVFSVNKYLCNGLTIYTAIMVISYRRFRTTYWSRVQWSRIQKEALMLSACFYVVSEMNIFAVILVMMEWNEQNSVNIDVHIVIQISMTHFN